MNYYDILKEREKYKIAENLYKCPICKAEKTIKGFMQHVKNHFFERDISNFRNAGNEKKIRSFIEVLQIIIIKSRIDVYIAMDQFLQKRTKKYTMLKKESFVAVGVLQNIVMHTGVKMFA